MQKLRVWWVPQVGIKNMFYIPVDSVEEGKKFLDTLAAYDQFQYENRIKPDFCNTGGLQMWDDEIKEWTDWYYEDDENYYEDVDEYCEEISSLSAELESFSRKVFEQVNFNMRAMIILVEKRLMRKKIIEIVQKH